MGEDHPFVDQHLEAGHQEMLGRLEAFEFPLHALGEGAAHGAQQALHRPDHQRPGDGVAVGKVLIERADADAGAAGDRVGGEPAVPAPGQRLGAGVQDGLDRGLGSALPR